MKKLKNWAIKKLGGKTEEEFFQAVKRPNGPKIPEEHRKVVPYRAYLTIRFPCRLTQEEIRQKLGLEIAKGVTKNLKISSVEYPERLETTYSAQILVVEDEEQ